MATSFFISDLHLTPERPQSTETFLEFLRNTAGSAERLYILGDLFEYSIDTPVTIRKSESAMLPFFRERIPARRLFIYDQSSGSQHPLTAAEITNGSGATLDGGAITVYDAGAYAGEALVETIKAGDQIKVVGQPSRAPGTFGICCAELTKPDGSPLRP